MSYEELMAFENVKLDFSLELERVMLDKGLSVEDVARISGLSRRTVNNILRGDAPLTFESASNLAHRLGLRLVVSMAPL
jgi:transcriptional regulator with XRE-family HTH domain